MHPPGVIVGWMAWFVDEDDEPMPPFSSAESRWEDLPSDGFQIARIFYSERTNGGVRYSDALCGCMWNLVDMERSLVEGNAHDIDENVRRYRRPREWWKRGRTIATYVHAAILEEARASSWD
jgi:hypothetical protein